jgi:cell division protein FtsQ
VWVINRSPQALERVMMDAERVEAVWVKGRHHTSLEDLRQALSVDSEGRIGESNLDVLRDRVKGLPWTEGVVVRKTLPGALTLYMTERQPLAIWQKKGRLYLLDLSGHIIPCPEASYPPTLLTVVGDQAPQGTQALLTLLGSFKDLTARVQAATRLRSGRWDLYLKDRVILKLPAQDSAAALQRFLALESQKLLSTADFDTIDLRFADRLIVRKRAPSLEAQRT